MLGLINDILDLSKIEAGKMELFLEDFAVAALVAEVEATIRPLVDKNANSLDVDLAPDLGVMHSDQTKIRQSLFNLLSNATKFTTGGRISLAVRRATRDDRDWLEFEVSDTGIGIAAEHLGRLFRRSARRRPRRRAATAAQGWGWRSRDTSAACWGATLPSRASPARARPSP